MTVIDLIAVISFGLTSFMAGYNIGKRKQPPNCHLSGY